MVKVIMQKKCTKYSQIDAEKFGTEKCNRKMGRLINRQGDCNMFVKNMIIKRLSY